jgi:hypothetical protein
MKWLGGMLAAVVLFTPALAQDVLPKTTASESILQTPEFDGSCPQCCFNRLDDSDNGFMKGTRSFPGFIGFISNPIENIDPRSLTQLFPVFGSNWVSASPPLPSGNMQLYGAGLTVALSERLSMGLNQGGYVVSDFSRTNRFGQPATILPGGSRDGWLNLGGFFQYTLIQDVPNQFLFTTGIRWEAPSGEAEVFQGHGPAYLSPYFTAGKEFGKFHVLATAGYQFPTGPGRDTTNTFYGNIHFDRQFFGWLYPLVEFNFSYHETAVDLSLNTRRGFFDFGTFEATGNILTVAPGVNAVLIPNKLEIGAVYITPIASQGHFDFNGLLVKMILRY